MTVYTLALHCICRAMKFKAGHFEIFILYKKVNVCSEFCY